MIEVNYQCRPCRPFTSGVPCTSCLESQLEMVDRRQYVKQNAELAERDEHQDVLSILAELELAEADDMAA